MCMLKSLKLFPSFKKFIFSFLLQVGNMCCPSLSAVVTCPEISKERQYENLIQCSYIIFLIRLIHARPKYSPLFHCIRLLNVPLALTHRHSPCCSECAFLSFICFAKQWRMLLWCENLHFKYILGETPVSKGPTNFVTLCRSIQWNLNLVIRF